MTKSLKKIRKKKTAAVAVKTKNPSYFHFQIFISLTLLKFIRIFFQLRNYIKNISKFRIQSIEVPFRTTVGFNDSTIFQDCKVMGNQVLFLI